MAFPVVPPTCLVYYTSVCCSSFSFPCWWVLAGQLSFYLYFGASHAQGVVGRFRKVKHKYLSVFHICTEYTCINEQTHQELDPKTSGWKIKVAAARQFRFQRDFANLTQHKANRSDRCSGVPAFWLKPGDVHEFPDFLRVSLRRKLSKLAIAASGCPQNRQ